MDSSIISVLVVDDSFFMRKIICDFLQADPAIKVVGEAENGAKALELIAQLKPQVVTLDIEMPVMNGLETMKALINLPQHPSIVIVSGYVKKGADVTLQCLSLGAADFVLKPSGSFSLDMDRIKDSLVTKVKNAAKVDTAKARFAQPATPRTWHYNKSEGIVVIGASTGGPTALELLLPGFSENFPYPIVVAQHLPKEFTASFVSRLRKVCRLPVVNAKQDIQLLPRTIYIAPGGAITTIHQVSGKLQFKIKNDVQDIETPSIDQLMESAAAIYHQNTIGVILTGMGKDGTEGMIHIKQAGGHTIVQDESTSAIFGMGNEVVSQGLADAVVPLKDIIQKISELLM